MNKQTSAWRAVNEYGLGWLAARFAYEMQVRTGFQALRFPQRSWAEDELATWLAPKIPARPDEYSDYWREHRPPFFFEPSSRAAHAQELRGILGDAGLQSLSGEASQIEQGVFGYFFSQLGEPGFPPDWHRNPLESNPDVFARDRRLEIHLGAGTGRIGL
jgi:hypothetical protein